MIVGTSFSAFADSVKEKKDKEEDIYIYINDEKEIDLELLKKGYIYIINSDIQTRAICYNCGNPGLYLQTVIAQDSYSYHVCPSYGPDLTSDIIFKTSHKVYEKCNYCSLNLLANTSYSYQTECHFAGGYSLFNVSRYKSVSQGYNPHECPDGYSSYSFTW